MAAARTVWFSFHLACHRSATSLSALNVSPLILTTALMLGLDPCFSSPTHQGKVQCYYQLLVFLLVPSSHWVSRGSLYSLPLVRSSCPLSAGVLHALLCLKVYSWCIRGGRRTPRPPTPPSSCSPPRIFIFKLAKPRYTVTEIQIVQTSRQRKARVPPHSSIFISHLSKDPVCVEDRDRKRWR